MMKLYDFAQFPDETKLKFSATELEFLLQTLTRVHTSLVDTVKDKTAETAARKLAYDIALSTENIYASIFKQLKLHRPTRTDLH